MISCWASHSAAMASAIPATGAVSARPEGVRTGLPSRMMAKPSGDCDNAGLGIEALALRPARGAPHRLLRVERRLSGDFIE